MAPPAQLPVSQLESLRFKANQILESINALHFILAGAYDYQHRMPAWPEILSKYNIILSQTHNFTNSLVSPFPTASSSKPKPNENDTENANIFQRMAIHPNMPTTEQQFNFEIGPLLRNVQTTDILNKENDTVRRLSEHMQTKGSLALKKLTLDLDQLKRKQEPGQHDPALTAEIALLNTRMNQLLQDVVRECEEIRDAHDRLVDRAVKAVALLRDRYDWKSRIEDYEYQEEEEEEAGHHFDIKTPAAPKVDDEDDGMDIGDDEDEDEGEDEDMAQDDKDRGSSDADENDVEQLMEKGFDDMPTPGSADLFGAPDNGGASTEPSDAMQGVS